ncbi:glycine-rich protein DOT1-like [Pistacia vera]|uniref:glycine-rich protein DOT1-like n=1 Tax=Pistacia vera TaxID=55513 RepID=UPI0012637CFD|nr:glycine-rich protein DOT1-like [Pistacia vera]
MSDGSPELKGILQNLKVMLDKLNTARVMNRVIMNALLEITGLTIHIGYMAICEIGSSLGLEGRRSLGVQCSSSRKVFSRVESEVVSVEEEESGHVMRFKMSDFKILDCVSLGLARWELFGGVDGVCGGGEAFGGSDGGDGDEFEGEGGLVGRLATGGGGGEFVGGVNTGGGEGELLGGLDTSNGGGDELIGGLDAIGGGGGGRDELVGGLDIGGDGGGDVGSGGEEVVGGGEDGCDDGGGLVLDGGGLVVEGGEVGTAVGDEFGGSQQ